MDIDHTRIDLTRLSGCKMMHLHYSPWPAKVVWVAEDTQVYSVGVVPEVVARWPGPGKSICIELEIEHIKLKQVCYPEKGVGYIRQWLGWGPKSGTLVKRRVENPNAVPRSHRLIYQR